MKQNLINALNCALSALRGTAGGFSPHEKANAIETLQAEQNRLIEEWKGQNVEP